MAYANQNFMTNRRIKEEVDKNQKGYVPPAEEEQDTTPKHTSKYDVILTKADYNRVLADEESGLSRYYRKYPREDGVDADGNPVRDPDTEVVGHTWESAISAPTDPAQTSTFPWISVAFNNFAGVFEIKYDGESKLTADIEKRHTLWIISIPNDLGMTDYRLEWGTGAAGTKTFDPSLLEVTFTESE